MSNEYEPTEAQNSPEQDRGHGHGRGHGPGPGHRPRGGYFGRGRMKFAILYLLKEKPRHGYDIIREIEERSGGAYSPSPGVVYPTLQALEDQDYIRSTEEDGKKIYSVTEAGLAYLEGHREKMREGHGPGGRGCGERGRGMREGGPHGHRGPGPGRHGGGHRYHGEGREGKPTEGEGRDSFFTYDPRAGENSAGDDPFRSHEGHGPAGAGFGAWFSPGEMPEMMKEVRSFFGDFAGAFQRTVTDPEKIKEIRQVLAEAKQKIDQIVTR